MVSTLILRLDEVPLGGKPLILYTVDAADDIAEYFLNCLRTFVSLQTLEILYYHKDNTLLQPIPSILNSLSRNRSLRRLTLTLSSLSRMTGEQFLEVFCAEEVQESFKGLGSSFVSFKLSMEETEGEHDASWWKETIVSRSPFFKSLLDIEIRWKSPRGDAYSQARGINTHERSFMQQEHPTTHGNRKALKRQTESRIPQTGGPCSRLKRLDCTYCKPCSTSNSSDMAGYSL